MSDTLGRRLRAARRAAGLSQAALARGLMSESHLSLLERDLRRPSPPLLHALAARLQVPVTALAWQSSDTGRVAPECRILQGWRLLQQGHACAAERLATQVLADRPGAERVQRALALRGASRLAQARHRAALADLDAAITVAQHRRDTRTVVELSVEAARIRRQLGRDDAA